MQKNVLVLSCNTGQGHNSAARAVTEAFLAHGARCEMRDALSFASENVSRIISKSYIGVAVKAPKVFQLLYEAGGFISSDKHRSIVYAVNCAYAGALCEYILSEKFDAVVAPHLFPAEALTHMRKREMTQVKWYAVATDYTCIPFWEETQPDQFFIPHASLAGEFSERGILSEHLCATGIPVCRAFCEKLPRREARARLSLPLEGRMYLVMSGSMGFGNLEKITDPLLAACGEEDCVVVICGNNVSLLETLTERYRENQRMVVIGYTDQAAIYMDACDVLLTKPGGLTSTEAAVKNVPLVHTAPIPGCETANRNFFRQNGLSLSGETYEECAAAAVALAWDEKRQETMLEAQRRSINPKAADEICSFVLRECGGAPI